MIVITSLFLAALSVAEAIVCTPDLCKSLASKEPLECKGSVIKNGGFCGCNDACAKQEGEECQAFFVRGRPTLGTCDTGLVCRRIDHMIVGAGKCEKNQVLDAIKTSREIRTLCEQKRMQSLLSMVVYEGQWLPKCDTEGLFHPEQCDNTGSCFCVNVNTGEVDESTKQDGKADCEDNPRTVTALQAREISRTTCEQERIRSMIVQIVYEGQWFPKCDADGNFVPEQCDNTGACFCVDIYSGEVDESTKTQGSATCDAIHNETADSTTQLYTTSSIPESG